MRSLHEVGLTEEQLKRQLRDQLLMQRVIDARVRSSIVVSPQEVAHELALHPELVKSGDRVHALHLLIRVSDQRSESQAKARVEEVMERLNQGEPFAALVKEYSDESGATDGDVGWVAPGELMPELDAVLFQLQPGQHSQPLQTKLGFHLLKVEERRSSEQLSMMEANQAVYHQLFQRKFQQAFQDWLSELRRQAYIELVGTSSE